MRRQQILTVVYIELIEHNFTQLACSISRAVFVRFSLGSEFRLAMTDRATIAGMGVAKLVPWNSLLNY